MGQFSLCVICYISPCIAQYSEKKTQKPKHKKQTKPQTMYEEECEFSSSLIFQLLSGYYIWPKEEYLG